MWPLVSAKEFNLKCKIELSKGNNQIWLDVFIHNFIKFNRE